MKHEWIWSIAGYDPSGSSGALADKSIFMQKGMQSCEILTFVSAQNLLAVEQINPLPANFIETQIELLKQTCLPGVIKIGALGDAEIIQSMANSIKEIPAVIIYDPVISASSEYTFTPPCCYDLVCQMLLPLCAVFTPNIVEAEALLDMKIDMPDKMIDAARQFLTLGCRSVYLKGGHLQGEQYHDLYMDKAQYFFLTSSEVIKQNVRGTGCRLSALFACNWMIYKERVTAIIQSRMELQALLSEAEPINYKTAICLSRSVSVKTKHLPKLAQKPMVDYAAPFPDCGEQPLGLYPIVDSAQWVEKLIHAGITTIQLRIKSGSASYIEEHIKRSIEITNLVKARLFINDYWQLAIKHQAYGVHLGQSDLDQANLSQIKDAGLRLGISTHSHYEMLRAYSLNPSYLAFGPIYPTKSKQMSFSAQGLDKLKFWLALIDCPMVAIGGINDTNIEKIADLKVSGIAMISAITQSHNIGDTITRYLTLCA